MPALAVMASPTAMKVSRPALLAGFGALALSLFAADATTSVDYTARNGQFATGATISPERSEPRVDEAVQDKRFDKKTVEKLPAAVGDRRAAIDVTETREKNVREKE